jgi:exosortase/archaeosortase family protein
VLRRWQDRGSAIGAVMSRPAVVFVGQFATTALVLLGVYYFPYEQGSAPKGWIDSWLHATAVSAGFLLHLFANDIHVYGDEIVGDGFAMRIVRTCDAADVMILLSSAVLAWPRPWIRRVVVAVAGLVIIYALNVLRIVTLYGLGARHPAAFEFAHLELWPVVLLLAAVAIFYWQAKPRPVEAAR